MLQFDEIIRMNAEITNRPISQEAARLLYNGSVKYQLQCIEYLDHDPNREEAMNSVGQVLSMLRVGEGEITAQELMSACEQLPWPFNRWFC